jgi:uncharacterized FlgJ-related protein
MTAHIFGAVAAWQLIRDDAYSEYRCISCHRQNFDKSLVCKSSVHKLCKQSERKNAPLQMHRSVAIATELYG